jgi:hypothetical protein
MRGLAATGRAIDQNISKGLEDGTGIKASFLLSKKDCIFEKF